MKKLSEWTTYFPISERNGFGANIWIPAKLINGYVVAPGATFDFWKAVGPVTRDKGFKQGGAIIQGCGMDMGFSLVYELGAYLWPEGTDKPHGTRNGEPDSDGGYALNHRWL